MKKVQLLNVFNRSAIMKAFNSKLPKRVDKNIEY